MILIDRIEDLEAFLHEFNGGSPFVITDKDDRLSVQIFGINAESWLEAKDERVEEVFTQLMRYVFAMANISNENNRIVRSRPVNENQAYRVEGHIVDSGTFFGTSMSGSGDVSHEVVRDSSGEPHTNTESSGTPIEDYEDTSWIDNLTD